MGNLGTLKLMVGSKLAFKGRCIPSGQHVAVQMYETHINVTQIMHVYGMLCTFIR